MKLQASTLRATRVPEQDWDKFVQCFPDQTVFHSLAWIRTVARVYNARILLIKCERDGECEALWPCLAIHKGPMRILGSPLPGWNTVYMGPLFKPDVDVATAIRAMLQHPAVRRHAYFACKVCDRDRDIDLGAFGFTPVRQYQTLLLDLTQTEDALWKNLRRQCRNHIRNAMRNDIDVRFESDGDFLDQFHQMTVETYARTNAQPPFTRRFLNMLWSQLHPLGLIKAISAFHKNQRIATLMLPRNAHTTYYWDGASYPAYRHLNAHNLLHWEAIRQARQAELQTYDFIGCYGSWGRFKESFGPVHAHTSTHWERSSSRFISLLKNGFEHYLRHRSKGARWPMIAALRSAMTLPSQSAGLKHC